MAETKAVQRKADMLPAPIVSLVQALVPDCNALLPPDITTEQFRAALWLELTGCPELNDCYPDSLRTCIVEAAQDGMLPGRDCHFLPFRQKDKQGKRATKVDNYHGLQRALERTGKVVHSWAAPVCEQDEWDFNRFLPQPLHREAMTLGKTPGKELFYYGAILFKDGHCAFETMSLDAIEAIRKMAPAHETGPWRDWPEMMKRKTALKRVCKYVPVTPDVRRILDADDARLQLDIPEERHRDNIDALYGDTHGSPNASNFVRDTSKVETSPGVQTPGTTTQPQPAGEPARGKKQPSPDEPAWKHTLRAHREALGQMAVSGVYDEDARGRLASLVERVDFALSPLGGVKDAEGFDLAAATLEWTEMSVSQRETP